MIFPRISLQNDACFEMPEELILKAIDAGLQTIGFSVRAGTSFDFRQGMEAEQRLQNRATILHLAEQYREKIQILLAETRDFYADPVFADCDYRVGTVGYLLADDGAICPLDVSPEELINTVNAHFGGSFSAFAKCYYETLANLARKTKCDVVADFDLLHRVNDPGRLFDAQGPLYRSAVLDAMEALVAVPVIFEIKMTRQKEGNLPPFTPSPDIVRWLAAHGATFLLSVPFSCKEAFLTNWEACVSYANSCGISSVTIPARQARKTFPLLHKKS